MATRLCMAACPIGQGYRDGQLGSIADLQPSLSMAVLSGRIDMMKMKWVNGQLQNDVFGDSTNIPQRVIVMIVDFLVAKLSNMFN